MAVNNPWSPEFWSITAQGAYIKQYGLSVAQRTARLANSSIGALRATTNDPRVIERQWVIQKKIGSTTTTGSPTGGSSGNGPPS